MVLTLQVSSLGFSSYIFYDENPVSIYLFMNNTLAVYKYGLWRISNVPLHYFKCSIDIQIIIMLISQHLDLLISTDTKNQHGVVEKH